MEIPQLTKAKQTKNTYKRRIRNLFLRPCILKTHSSAWIQRDACALAWRYIHLASTNKTDDPDLTWMAASV